MDPPVFHTVAEIGGHRTLEFNKTGDPNDIEINVTVNGDVKTVETIGVSYVDMTDANMKENTEGNTLYVDLEAKNSKFFLDGDFNLLQILVDVVPPKIYLCRYDSSAPDAAAQRDALKTILENASKIYFWDASNDMFAIQTQLSKSGHAIEPNIRMKTLDLQLVGLHKCNPSLARFIWKWVGMKSEHMTNSEYSVFEKRPDQLEPGDEHRKFWVYATMDVLYLKYLHDYAQKEMKHLTDENYKQQADHRIKHRGSHVMRYDAAQKTVDLPPKYQSKLHHDDNALIKSIANTVWQKTKCMPTIRNKKNTNEYIITADDDEQIDKIIQLIHQHCGTSPPPPKAHARDLVYFYAGKKMRKHIVMVSDKDQITYYDEKSNINSEDAPFRLSGFVSFKDMEEDASPFQIMECVYIKVMCREMGSPMKNFTQKMLNRMFPEPTKVRVLLDSFILSMPTWIKMGWDPCNVDVDSAEYTDELFTAYVKPIEPDIVKDVSIIEKWYRTTKGGTSGLHWKQVGKEKPINGIDLTKILETAFVREIEKDANDVKFAQKDWDSFGVKKLTLNDFVLIKGTYYQPYVGDEVTDIRKKYGIMRMLAHIRAQPVKKEELASHPLVRFYAAKENGGAYEDIYGPGFGEKDSVLFTKARQLAGQQKLKNNWILLTIHQSSQ